MGELRHLRLGSLTNKLGGHDALAASAFEGHLLNVELGIREFQLSELKEQLFQWSLNLVSFQIV